MKKVLVMLALVGLLAAPAYAGIVNVSPSGAVKVLPAGPRGAPIYADLTTSGYYMNAGTTASYPLPVGDDIHAISGGTITSFVLGYYTTEAAPFNLHVRFYASDATDGGIPPTPPGAAPAPIADYVLNGLPGAGGWFVTIPGVNVPVGQDFWFEEDWSNSWGAIGATAVATGGPLIATSGGTVGYSHSTFSQTGSLWGLSIWADWVLEFDTPEPATIGLLAMAGLFILRRR
jgi:hypothetical protein